LKFFVQAGVISLQKLLVLEKAVGQDTRSIYLIRSNPDEPEMYELQCQNPREKRVYIDMIGAAVALRNVFLPEIKAQSQRDFCLSLFSALVRIYFFILRRIRRGSDLLNKLEEREGSARITYSRDCGG
jgi:hypothetical protein